MRVMVAYDSHVLRFGSWYNFPSSSVALNCVKANAQDPNHSDLPALADDILSNAINRGHLFEVSHRGTAHIKEHTQIIANMRFQRWLPRMVGALVVVALLLGGLAYQA